MSESNLVWYASYGSNILTDRFRCYIAGGQPLGSQRTYEGCRDTSVPRADKPTTINHELYFSKNSPVWDNGGVGFISIQPDKTKTTFARMYLITEQQLTDVAKQETNSNNYLNINFMEAVENGNTIFKSPSWYGKL